MKNHLGSAANLLVHVQDHNVSAGLWKLSEEQD